MVMLTASSPLAPPLSHRGLPVALVHVLARRPRRNPKVALGEQELSAVGVRKRLHELLDKEMPPILPKLAQRNQSWGGRGRDPLRPPSPAERRLPRGKRLDPGTHELQVTRAVFLCSP